MKRNRRSLVQASDRVLGFSLEIPLRSTIRACARLTVLAMLATACAATLPDETGTMAAEPAATAASGTDEVQPLDARLTDYVYPFEVHMWSFESQRQPLEMAYMDVAPTTTANGRTVLLLHGKNFSGAYWEDTARALAGQGFRVVIPDQIGFGKSSKPQAYQFTFDALAWNTNALLDTLGVDDVAVVGHSMGGMLATRFALHHPERTEQLVLVNPIGLEDWQQFVPYVPVETWYEQELGKTPQGVRDYMEASYFDGQWKPEYDALAELQAGWALSPDKERLAWVAALTYDMVLTQPVVYELGRVTTPTLLIIGTRDRTALGKNLVAPEIAATMGDYDVLGERAAAAIPGAELVEIEGVGHIPQVEAWTPYIDALTGFLTRAPKE